MFQLSRHVARSNAFRSFTTSASRLGVNVHNISDGDGKTFPKKGQFAGTTSLPAHLDMSSTPSGDFVTIHYTGKLADGKVFDSSVTRGSPFQTQIGVGQVIKGWDEGVLQLSLGQKVRPELGIAIVAAPYAKLSLFSQAVLVCSPDYAYGSRGYPPVIPANSELSFEVELLKIE